MKPYLEVTRLEYNPDYGDERVCVCGHPYHRHFDGYENNRAVGCKYCQCRKFVEDDETEAATIAKLKARIAVLESVLWSYDGWEDELASQDIRDRPGMTDRAWARLLDIRGARRAALGQDAGESRDE